VQGIVNGDTKLMVASDQTRNKTNTNVTVMGGGEAVEKQLLFHLENPRSKIEGLKNRGVEKQRGKNRGPNNRGAESAV
jgi:hypothetical protein